MQRALLGSLLLLISSATVVAQASGFGVPESSARKFDPKAGNTQPETVYTVGTDSAASCPVSMRARQGGSWDMVKTGSRQPRDSRPSQTIRLSIGGDQSGHAVAARVKVHGLNGRARFTAASDQAGPAEITRMLDVRFDGDDSAQPAANLVLRGFTSVRSIELESLTYADGSQWAADRSVCRVAPDPLMLVER